jgi:DNA repair exonuclease SbcCD ATPase subunit
MRFRRPDLRVESFEYVEVGPELALLRLAGEWRGEEPAGVRLLGAGEELAALPEPPSDGAGGLWRAAWSAPAAVLGGPFVLEGGDGRVVELPLPRDAALPAVVVEPKEEAAPEAELETAAEAAPEAEPAAEAPPEPEPTADPLAEAPPEPEPAAEAPPDPIAEAAPEPDRSTLEALATAERALESERARHERAEASLRAQLQSMVAETADFMGRLEGYELRRAELEKELSWERLLHRETRKLKDTAELERDEAAARLAPVEEELTRIRREVEASARAQRQLVEARERIAELERRLEEQETLLGSARAVVESGGDRLAELEERLMRLRDAATGVTSGNGHAPALVASAGQVEAVERAIEEADRGSERLAQLERRVGELREGIASQPIVEQRPVQGTVRGRRRFLR